ncbi:MFS transporter [Gordonibacter massiliensis (ex Traore et al. 2017)]|uniref:MFS transporter n=1 Tax=Gordonibacter massiliensis (ex Traore et al. 2017) TaxID=1841863 RepID=A0A842JJK5_9ACTN|nr:MFS transporter [Gordonibacter massiliensis (ex Traore et al. 2017)]MBC2889280.1 MFS transporter [Gordonibacter massiliensis (ex Traore et al. 2017)]
METVSKTRPSFVAALLVALAFALGFAEFVLIGITPDVAEGLGEPLTLIGDIVGYYALACAVAAPVVALATARANRFKLTAVLLVVFNAGNLLTLFADGYALLLMSRLLPAATSGTLLAIALTYVPEIVDAGKVARVLSFVLAGFSVSSVVGVPIGTALADAFGWKAAYACVLALGLVVSALLLPALPRKARAAHETTTLRSQLRLLGDRRVLANIAMILAGAASTYVFYTYLTPVLEDVMGFGGGAVSVILFALGAACVASNLLSGWVANRFGMRALPLTFALHAALLALLAVTVPLGAAGLADIACVCLLMYVMNSTVQMLFQDVARRDYPSALTFSSSLHPMSFNAGIALGSFAGGVAVNAGGLLATGPIGALFALVAAVLALVLVRLTARGRKESATTERLSNKLEDRFKESA